MLLTRKYHSSGARVLGLELGLDEAMMASHQARAWKALDSPFGLQFWADKTRDYSCAPLPGGQAHDLFTADTVCPPLSFC
eukprot:SAG22_NODE_873_length_6721_cov_19.182395_4_plen_80_part_00